MMHQNSDVRSFLISSSPLSAACLIISSRPCFLPEQWKLIGSRPAARVAVSGLKMLDHKHTHKVLRAAHVMQRINLSDPKVHHLSELLVEHHSRVPHNELQLKKTK